MIFTAHTSVHCSAPWCPLQSTLVSFQEHPGVLCRAPWCPLQHTGVHCSAPWCPLQHTLVSIAEHPGVLCSTHWCPLQHTLVHYSTYWCLHTLDSLLSCYLMFRHCSIDGCEGAVLKWFQWLLEKLPVFDQ